MSDVRSRAPGDSVRLDPGAFAVRLDVHRRVLPNGLVALALANKLSPSVAIRGSVRGGATLDSDDSAGLANLAARLFLSGTATRDAAGIADAIDFVGASLRAWGGRYAIGFGGQALARDRDTLLGVLADVLRSAVFPEEEVAREKGRVTTAILEENDDPGEVAVNRFREALYPAGHFQRRNEMGTEATVERIDRAALAALHRDHVRPDRTLLALAGDFDPERTLDRVEDLFGDWKATGNAAPPAIPDAVGAPARRVDHSMPGKSQSEIASGTTGIARTHPDYYALTVGNLVLGQLGMGGRLGRAVREEEGLAYSIHSGFEAGAGAGPFLISAGVNPANVERAIAGIDTVLAATLADGLSVEEVDEAKRYLAASLPRRVETNESIAAELHEMEFLGLGTDFLSRLPGILEGVTRESATEALRRHVRPAERITVVAGPLP